MAELDDRRDLEAALAAIWARELATQLRAVIRSLAAGVPFDSASVWVAAQVRATLASLEILQQIFSAGVSSVGQEVGQGVFAESIINDRGVAWATEHAAEMVRGINQTTLTRTRRIVTRGLQEGQSIDDIAKKLQGTYGRSRAQTIAITETTDASVIGQREFIDQLEREGVFTFAKWNTAQDSRVDDKICKPLHGVLKQDGVYIHPISGKMYEKPGSSAHPNCRCWERYEPVEEAIAA